MAGRVYLAGPDVFLSDAPDILAMKVRICAELGLEGVSPIAGEAPPDASGIFAKCEAAMGASDMILANMTPFRGPGMDAGTAYEVGYMRAQGKPIFGYSNAPGDYASRVPDARSRNGHLTDADGLTVEDFGRAENLMLACAAEAFGFPVFRPSQAPADPVRDLEAFRMAVQAAASHCGRTT